jgi:hypothetical protein
LATREKGMALVCLATLPHMIFVQTTLAIICLSRPILKPGKSRASQDRRPRLAARAACRERLQVVHQKLWGAPWMRSAQVD